jgi:ring-1,2-phenylacetyl-CoA epoxidase subunit PaaE
MSNQFYKLKVKEIVRETADAITIYFDQPSEKKIEYKPGQFLTLQFVSEGEKIRRAYSLCTSPYIDKDFGVTVKRVQGGKVSGYLNQTLKAGDVIDVMEPLGNFTTTFGSNAQRNLVFFGGGSGITPLMSLIKTALLLEPKSSVSLVYANRDTDSIIFKASLNDLEKKYPNFKLVHVLENPPSGFSGIKGLINPSVVREILKTLPQSSNTEYFICGPEPLMNIVTDSLISLGISKELIRRESFESQAASEAANKSEEELKEEGIITREVKVIYDGDEFNFIVPPEKTILEAALDLDIDLPYSCQSGLCTACRGKCLSGKIKMVEDEGLSEREKKEGYVLLCVGHPLTKDVVVEIG